MQYGNVVKDFARRTRKNLDLLRDLQDRHPDTEYYEVTHLINSMLGLLVFPQQRYLESIPETPLDELARKGWPIPTVIGDYPQVNDLRQLVRYLRNAITHFNVEFLSDETFQIRGLRVWNARPVGRADGGRVWETTWEAELTIEDIEKITDKFVQLLLEE
ncbi:MAG: hypothetical protein KAW49_11375 [Anaerolineae bacterium]|nr:hypothetical protein [Anaerolineae bacterium]